MRNAFADEVTRIGSVDSRVALLSGDIGNKLFDKFKAAAPERFFNCGVAEANMMGVAAGLALSGLRPVVYTITPFTTTRCFEQIRVDVCYHDAPVVIVGTGSGLSYAELGPTHHSLEDMAILRTLPGMNVLAPCDEVELRLALRAALSHQGPSYIRIGKKGEPIIHQQVPAFTLGRSIALREGRDVCLIGAGTVMPELLAAADELTGQGHAVGVESFPCVKPLDTQRLGELFTRYRLVAVVEEHGLIGGLSSAVAEWKADQSPGALTQMLRFGATDEFLHTAGSQAWARGRYGLTAEQIVARVSAALR